MVQMTVKLWLVLSCAIVAVSSAGILETLLSWNLRETQARSSTLQSKCMCQASGCLCCVDLNLTSTIDLDGPACVNIKQKDNNVSLHLTYGDNPVHNATIKIEDAANKPTCMNLLSDLAQLCAKFTSMTTSKDLGYDGCLVIEPALMRTPQATYHVGCFNFYQGVRQTQAPVVEATTTSYDLQQEEDEDDEVALNTEELLAAVSSTAEQGIALFSQWLGLNLSPRVNSTEEPAQGSGVRQETGAVATTARSGRNIPDEPSEERFKQLLSAQDNILKESARIGHMDDGQTTFIYPQSFDANQNRKSESLPVVPRESRRGGRAYNIHQHVNEI